MDRLRNDPQPYVEYMQKAMDRVERGTWQSATWWDWDPD